MKRLSTRAILISCRMLLVICILCSHDLMGNPREKVRRVTPMIHATDLYHPHGDPDDHFDLATVFGIAAFDLRAVVIDMGKDGVGRPGMPPVQQMMHITGKTVPCATGWLSRG